MKGSGKRLPFSSPPIKSFASSKGSHENDRSNQEMDFNLQNPKKETVKNFMSPTISSAPNASFPRKKILAERNESPGSNFSNTLISKPLNLDYKASTRTITKTSQRNSPDPDPDPKLTSEKVSSTQKTPLSYNSKDETPSPETYDPLTNYLSPRPQFLRYNPDRRKEIFLRLKMEDKREKEDDDDEFSVRSSASFNSKKVSSDEADDSVSCENSSSSQEAEEIDFESDEETEEEVGWSLKGLLKYSLLMFVLVITTLHISSMNSPGPAQSFEGLGLDHRRIQNNSYGGFVGFKLLDGKQGHFGLFGLNQGNTEKRIEEERPENHVEEVREEGKTEDACEGELVKRSDVSYQIQEKETAEKIEDVKEHGESVDEKLVNTEELPDQLVEDVELQDTEERWKQVEDVRENGASEDVEKVEGVKEGGESEDAIEQQLVKEGEASDQIVGDIEMVGEEIAGEIVSIQAVQACLLSDQQEDVSNTTDSSPAIPMEASEGIPSETRDVNMGNSITMETSSLRSPNSDEVNPPLNMFKYIGKEVLFKVLFGVLTCASIVAALALGSNIRIRTASKHSIKPVVNEKPSTALPAVTKEQNMHAGTAMNTVQPLIESTGQDEVRDSYQSLAAAAPSVKLVSEFEVGMVEIRSSSLNDARSKVAYSAPVQPDSPEFSISSTTNSILTPANKKVSRKDYRNNNDTAGSDGEGRNPVTTPLRRSARIRNRALVSP